jgi:hypothetical protein
MFNLKQKDRVNETWVQALALLYQACEPLTYDCLHTKEEQEALIKNITDHAYYCSNVKRDIEKGNEPQTWDEWFDYVKNWSVPEDFEVESKHTSTIPPIDPIDLQGFGDQLTKIYSGGE